MLTTPYRYPGAKSRIADRILAPAIGFVTSEWTFVDVFVGGGSVFLAAHNTIRQKQTVVNDLDVGISAFWMCVSDTELCAKLSDRILNTTPTVKEHAKQRQQIQSNDIVERGFSAFFLNRTSFSGILTSGPIGGYKQKSKYTVGCRYNAKLLSDKVLTLGKELSGKLLVFNDDFESVIGKFDKDNTLIYCDSPYFVKGNQLYRHGMSAEDHVRLSIVLRRVKRAKFIVSYDNVPEIVDMYSWARIDRILTRYSIEGRDRDSWNESTELLIHNF